MKIKVLFALIALLLNTSFDNGYWVKYGWEIFNTGGGSPSIALGNALGAYHGEYSGAYLVNPAHQVQAKSLWTLSHQSRFAGMINREMIAFPFQIQNRNIQSILFYEGIGQIPDTRDMLLDWGLDGQFGTNDLGEGNGVLDEGERLARDNLAYFGQYQFGAYFSTNVKLFQEDAGIGFKLLFHQLGEHSGLGIGFNLGILKKIGKGNLGLAIKDFPSSGIIWDNGTIEGTIPTVSLGYARPFQMTQFPVKINISLGSHFEFYDRALSSIFGIGNQGLSFDAGAEVIFRDKIKFQFGQSKDGFISSGLGLDFNRLSIHYAFLLTQPATQLGNNHYLSISFHPDWISEKIMSKDK
jgi:hypothetical protein